MLTFYDYLPSQNAWKVRQLLRHLAIPHRTELVSIFEGEGQSEPYLAINPWGAVPAIRLEDGRVLSESNAILWYLSEGSVYRPAHAFDEAKVLQWLSFEADYIQASVGSLRYWTLTGKLAGKAAGEIAGRRGTAVRALNVVDRVLRHQPFLAGETYSIADISAFAYAHLAADAGLDIEGLAGFRGWVERVRNQPGHLAEMFPYSIDPHSSDHLPS